MRHWHTLLLQVCELNAALGWWREFSHPHSRNQSGCQHVFSSAAPSPGFKQPKTSVTPVNREMYKVQRKNRSSLLSTVTWLVFLLLHKLDTWKISSWSINEMNFYSVKILPSVYKHGPHDHWTWSKQCFIFKQTVSLEKHYKTFKRWPLNPHGLSD